MPVFDFYATNNTQTFPGVTTNYNFVWNTPIFELLFSDYLARDRFHLFIARPASMTPYPKLHAQAVPGSVAGVRRIAGLRRHERNPLHKRALSKR